MTSGTRNPPPISTASPRETTTLAPTRQRGEDEQHGGGIVVHDHRGLRAARASDERRCVRVT